MSVKQILWTPTLLLAATACGSDGNVQPVVPTTIEASGGTEQSGTIGTPLMDSLRVRVTDASGNATAGVRVSWSVLTGGGSISPVSSNTNTSGVASAEFILGPTEGDQQAEATVSGLAGSPVVFTAHAFLQALVPTTIQALGGGGQTGVVGAPLPELLNVRVSDAAGNAVPGVTVSWAVLTGGGSLSPTSSVTNSSGVASTEFTLGPAEGDQQAQADVSGLAGSPVVFHETATPTTSPIRLTVAAGGNNVQERYSSDLWVYGTYAYTGTWGFRDELGNVLKVWSLGSSGAPTLTSSVTVPQIGTVSDVQVSDDGQFLVLSGERGDDGGIYTYSLSDPAHPSFLDSASVGPAGVHTVTLSTINGRRYAFAARNPGFSGDPDEDEPALVIYDVTDPSQIARTATVPVPQNYGIHDTFVRDALAFVFAWNTGVIIYDVGNGMRGGSPGKPVEVSRLVTSVNGVCCGPSVHNGWWFHNPVTGEKRYLFIGQEGAAVIGSESSGDIHVVDISDLTHPREVAFFHINGAGTHNFWVDEPRQVLYAAYYNAGVVALDISGSLSGNLSGRLLSQVRPGGPGNTFTWGVQLANGSLYAIDMLSGFWQLRTE